MKDLKEFNISFIGLKEGNHQFEFKIEKEFFDFFDFDEFYNSNIVVQLEFLKKATMFELNFKCSGSVEVTCDMSNEMFQQPVQCEFELIVKFGQEFNNEDENLLTIPYSMNTINIAQYIYESIVLGVPIRKIHPNIADGTLKSEVLDKLKEFELTNESKEISEEVDPRWNKLKEILIEKNTSNGTS